MRNTILVACLAALALALPSYSQSKCDIPQSPRRVWPQDQESKTSTVERGPNESIYYTPRAGGERQQLFLCGQHYHCYVENHQRCLDVPEPTRKARCPEHPSPGDWIEVHTVYAAEVASPCDDPEGLTCCLKQPFLVRAYQANVTAGGVEPLPDPWNLPLIQWSGSTTGPDRHRNECKPAAQWSFTPGCELKVSKELLESRFHHPHGVRGLQPENRLSKDLTLVTPP